MNAAEAAPLTVPPEYIIENYRTYLCCKSREQPKPFPAKIEVVLFGNLIRSDTFDSSARDKSADNAVWRSARRSDRRSLR